jgi:hypothetical protein
MQFTDILLGTTHSVEERYDYFWLKSCGFLMELAIDGAATGPAVLIEY